MAELKFSQNVVFDSERVARVLFSPSYISFETALAYYGLIPERVYAIKSATFKKNKKKKYNNSFGLFLYQDVNPNAYPYDINQIIKKKQMILIDYIP